MPRRSARAFRSAVIVAAWAAAGGGAAACDDDPASLRVIVREGARLPQRLDALRVDQWAVDADEDDGQRVGRVIRSIGAPATYAADGELVEWSVTLARAPGDPATQAYRVRAAGVRDGDDYVRIDARVVIVAGQASLTLAFESACALRRCATGQSCAAGRCTDDRAIGCAAIAGADFPWCDDGSGLEGGVRDAGLRESGVRCTGATGDCDLDPVNGCETDLTTSASHCSACGVACPPGETCEGGACVCGTTSGGGRPMGTRFSCADAEGPSGQHCCDGACIDVSVDLERCGSCDVACGSGESCEAGRCTCGTASNAGRAACASSEACCSGRGAAGGTGCVDVQSSASSCGSCTASCPANETCSDGACHCGGGATCPWTCDGSNCYPPSGD